jgi:hypothetical protein
MLSLPLLLGPFAHCELLEDEAEETGERKRGCSPAFWRILHAMERKCRVHRDNGLALPGGALKAITFGSAAGMRSSKTSRYFHWLGARRLPRHI